MKVQSQRARESQSLGLMRLIDKIVAGRGWRGWLAQPSTTIFKRNGFLHIAIHARCTAFCLLTCIAYLYITSLPSIIHIYTETYPVCRLLQLRNSLCLHRSSANVTTNQVNLPSITLIHLSPSRQPSLFCPSYYILGHETKPRRRSHHHRPVCYPCPNRLRHIRHTEQSQPVQKKST